MGMAASQSRYLALAARKTNTEYEGQQINQARTALANQSADLFNRLLDLDVPIAPKTTDYTEIQYSYSDGESESVIESWQQLSSANPDYNYVVNHYYYADVYTGSQKLMENPQVIMDSSTPPPKPIFIGNCELTELTSLSDDQAAELAQILKDCPNTNLDNYLSLSGTSLSYTGSGIYTFEYQGKMYFTSEEDLMNSVNKADGLKPIENQDKLPYYGASNVRTKIKETNNALLETDENGRFTSVKFDDDSVVYSLNTETVTNDKAYQDAMQEYNYKLKEYEKTIADINAKTSIIQQEDRTLELRLKQLDTEQKALATEMDAVKKIVKDTVDKVFKTMSD